MISNHRLYLNPNSAETAIFEHELEMAGIQFYRHDTGVTWTDNMTQCLSPNVVYTFFEEDFQRAQAILDKIRERDSNYTD